MQHSELAPEARLREMMLGRWSPILPRLDLSPRLALEGINKSKEIEVVPKRLRCKLGGNILRAFLGFGELFCCVGSRLQVFGRYQNYDPKIAWLREKQITQKVGKVKFRPPLLHPSRWLGIGHAVHFDALQAGYEGKSSRRPAENTMLEIVADALKRRNHGFIDIAQRCSFATCYQRSSESNRLNSQQVAARGMGLSAGPFRTTSGHRVCKYDPVQNPIGLTPPLVHERRAEYRL